MITGLKLVAPGNSKDDDSRLITETNFNDPNFFVYPGTPVTLFDINLIDGTGVGSPYKFFRVNNPIVGGWSGYVNEIVAPDTVEPVYIYMAQESDRVLEVDSDKERYLTW